MRWPCPTAPFCPSEIDDVAREARRAGPTERGLSIPPACSCDGEESDGRRRPRPTQVPRRSRRTPLRSSRVVRCGGVRMAVGGHAARGFTVTTAACVEYMLLDRTAPDGLAEAV